MKKSRAVLLSLITLLCLAFGIFASACGETDNNNDDNSGDTTTYYTVTLSYDSGKGTVTKSDPASSKGYVKDETVTISVSPKEEYKTGSVKAGDTVLDVGTDGKYTFKIAGDTTVTVTFVDDQTAKGDPVLLDASLYGTYKNMDGKGDDLVVSAAGVKWGDKDVYLAAPYEDGDLSYTVTVDGATYYLYVHDNGQIDLLDAASNGPSFLKEGITLSYTVTVNKTGEGTATLDPQKEKYTQGESVTLNVAAAEDWFVKDVVINGETVSLKDGAYTFAVTLDTTINVTFLAEGEIPAEFQGAWKNIEDDADTFTLTADSMTWTGHEVALESIAVMTDYLDPTPLGTELTVTIDGDSGNKITLYYGATAVEIMWMGTEGYEDHYYVLGDGIALDAGQLAPGAFTEVGGTKKLTVSDAGALTIDGTAVKLYSTGTEYLFYSNAVYTVEVRNNNYVIVSNPADYSDTDYVRDTISVTPNALLVGEWTESGGGKLVVNADGTATLTGVELLTAFKLVYSDLKGATVLLTTSSGTIVESLSLNCNEGEWSFGFYLDDGPVNFSKAGEKVVLGADWQTGYEYDGTEEYVDPARFIANEDGIALVNDFNVPIESSYFYGVKVSDTEYIVYVNYELYTLTLNDDNSITLSNGETAHTYTPCEIVPQDVFSVTLQYDYDQGYATLAGETPDGGWGDVYTLVKPAEGETYALTVLVTPGAGYKVKSVTVNGTALVDEAGNGRYAYNAEGTDITVVVEFEEAELEPLKLEDETLFGTTWSCADTDKKLTIDENGGVKFGEDVIELLSAWSETSFQVRCGGKSWTLSIDSNGIDFYDSNFSEQYYFIKDGGSTSTTYSVTINYAAAGDGEYTEAMGTASADKTSYNDGDTVVITVTPGEGYEVDSVTADGEVLVKNEDGTYTVEDVHGNVTVVVTFKAKAA